ncbi:MAG: trigger factor [Phycisphaeraceae bacterium]
MAHDHDHDHDTATADFEAGVKIEDAGPARKKLTVEIPAEAIQTKLSEGFEALKDEATIPGFRRGRVPMRLLEKRFGTDVRKETLNQLLGEAYSQAVEKNELRVLGEPEIKDMEKIELPDDGPLSFEAEVEVVPEVKLPDIAKLEVKKPAVEVADDRIDSELERYREMYGSPKTVSETDYNDFVTADVEVRDAEGEVVQESPQTQMLVPGEQRKFKGVVAGIVVDDLGKKLVNKKAGETITLEVTGPAQHEVEAMRDAKLTVDIAINSVQRQQPMPMEELIEAAGVENEEELRTQLRERLEQQAEAEQKQAMGSQVVDFLLDNVDMELPERLTARQAGQVLQRQAMEMMYRGATQEDIENQLAELRAASEEDAQRELKVLFILEAVAREHEIDVDEAEVNGRVFQMAMQQNRRPERVREEMQQNGQLNQIFVQLREQKAIEKLLEQAKVTEISAEEWNKQQEAEAEADEKKKPAKTTKKTAKGSKKKAEDKTDDAEKE